MRVIITGERGQLGRALQAVLTKQGITIVPLPQGYDVSDHTIVQMITALSPDLVIHSAAMTHVDGCAKDPDRAFRVNAFGSQNVAHGCMRSNADMVYISTNEVFSGDATTPYTEDDETNPINPYGSSKRTGEKMVTRYQPKLYIVRTSWLYNVGGNNFPSKMIALADKHKKLRVVDDEIGNPTYTVDLAEAIAKLIKTRVYGTYHLVNQGYCSRYDYAKEVLRLSGREAIPVEPIPSTEFERASTVPLFSPLANIKAAELGIQLRPWQEALVDFMKTSEYM